MPLVSARTRAALGVEPWWAQTTVAPSEAKSSTMMNVGPLPWRRLFGFPSEPQLQRFREVFGLEDAQLEVSFEGYHRYAIWLKIECS